MQEIYELANILDEDPDCNLEDVCSYIKKGIDVNSPIEDEDDTLINIAVLINRLDIIKVLISAGASVEPLTEGGDYPLVLAASHGFQEIFDYLSPITSCDNRIKATISLAEGIRRQVISIYGVIDGNVKTYIEKLSTNYLGFVRSRIEENLDINSCRETGSTLLWKASHHGYIDSVQLLLSSGAGVDVSLQTDGWTPLMIAAATHKAWLIGTAHFWGKAMSYQLEIVKILLEAQADINARSIDGKTPLIAAAMAVDEEMLSFLLEHGSEPNWQDSEGKTAKDYIESQSYVNSYQDAKKLFP